MPSFCSFIVLQALALGCLTAVSVWGHEGNDDDHDQLTGRHMHFHTNRPVDVKLPGCVTEISAGNMDFTVGVDMTSDLSWFPGLGCKLCKTNSPDGCTQQCGRNVRMPECRESIRKEDENGNEVIVMGNSKDPRLVDQVGVSEMKVMRSWGGAHSASGPICATKVTNGECGLETVVEYIFATLEHVVGFPSNPPQDLIPGGMLGFSPQSKLLESIMRSDLQGLQGQWSLLLGPGKEGARMAFGTPDEISEEEPTRVVCTKWISAWKAPWGKNGGGRVESDANASDLASDPPTEEEGEASTEEAPDLLSDDTQTVEENVKRSKGLWAFHVDRVSVYSHTLAGSPGRSTACLSSSFFESVQGIKKWFGFANDDNGKEKQTKEKTVLWTREGFVKAGSPPEALNEIRKEGPKAKIRDYVQELDEAELDLSAWEETGWEEGEEGDGSEDLFQDTPIEDTHKIPSTEVPSNEKDQRERKAFERRKLAGRRDRRARKRASGEERDRCVWGKNSTEDPKHLPGLGRKRKKTIIAEDQYAAFNLGVVPIITPAGLDKELREKLVEALKPSDFEQLRIRDCDAETLESLVCTCESVWLDQEHKWGRLVFEVNGWELDLGPRDYFWPIEDTQDSRCKLVIFSPERQRITSRATAPVWILGEAFLRRWAVGVSMKHRRVGFTGFYEQGPCISEGGRKQSVPAESNMCAEPAERFSRASNWFSRWGFTLSMVLVFLFGIFAIAVLFLSLANARGRGRVRRCPTCPLFQRISSFFSRHGGRSQGGGGRSRLRPELSHLEAGDASPHAQRGLPASSPSSAELGSSEGRRDRKTTIFVDHFSAFYRGGKRMLSRIGVGRDEEAVRGADQQTLRTPSDVTQASAGLSPLRPSSGSSEVRLPQADEGLLQKGSMLSQPSAAGREVGVAEGSQGGAYPSVGSPAGGGRAGSGHGGGGSPLAVSFAEDGGQSVKSAGKSTPGTEPRSILKGPNRSKGLG